MINKKLISPANKRAAIIERIAKVLFLTCWAVVNYIVYLKFKQSHKKYKTYGRNIKINSK